MKKGKGKGKGKVSSTPKSYPGAALPTPKTVAKVARPKAKKSKFISG